ncbi:DNA polymerase III subunit delta [bacterium]|nr:DNA polymerase III subunit delta [bacterium]
MAAKTAKTDALLAYKSFQKTIKDGKRFDVLVITGQELHLIQQARDFYVRSVLDPAQQDFDFCELRGSDIKGRELWDELTSLPFMAERRVVLIESPKEIKAAERAALTKYLANPVSTTSLVMIQFLEDKQDRLGAWSTKNAMVLDFPELNVGNREKWIVQYAKERGKTIQSEAISFLIETSSAQLIDIRSKLESASLYSGDDSEISVQTLMKIGGVSSDYDIFKLQDAILRGNASLALKIAKSLLDGGIELLALLGMLRGFLMRVWQVEAALRKPNSQEVIKAALGGQSFKSKEFIMSAKRLGRERLQQLVLDLLELEIHAKSKTSDTDYGFYDWIWCFSTPKSSGTQNLSIAYTG